jgi:hypothetical protein
MTKVKNPGASCEELEERVCSVVAAVYDRRRKENAFSLSRDGHRPPLQLHAASGGEFTRRDSTQEINKIMRKADWKRRNQKNGSGRQARLASTLQEST